MPTSRHGARAGAQLATCGEAYADGMMRSVQREIWGQLLSRRSSDITSRPETRRACPDRRTCVLLSARRYTPNVVLSSTRPLSAGRRRDHELPLCSPRRPWCWTAWPEAHCSTSMWSTGFPAGGVVHVGWRGWPSDGRHTFNQFTLELSRTTVGWARPGPTLNRPPGGLGGRLERTVPPRRTRVAIRDWV